MVLALMMVLTMFAGAAAEGELTPFTSYSEMGSAIYHIANAGINFADDGNAMHMQYLAQEFVPSTEAISGVKLAMNYGDGQGEMHIEIREGGANGEAVYTENIAVSAKGDGAAWYTFNFSQNVDVTPGTLYAVAFWFASKTSTGFAIIHGGAKSEQVLWRHKRFESDGSKTYEAADVTLKTTESTIGFEIMGVEATPSGEVVFFDDFMPHHAADRGAWDKDTNNFTTGDFAYRSMADSRSGDKISNGRLYRDDPVDITSLYNENGEFYFTFDFYADPDYVGQAAHYDNEGNLVETKDFGLENVRMHVLLYSKGELNASASEPKQAKQAIEITRWERTNANANETNDWNVFGLENGLQPGWNRMAVKLTDKDGVLTHGKEGQTQYWDPTKMWGVSFSMRLASWQDQANGSVETVFDNFRFMSVEAYEEKVAPIKENVQFFNMDTTDKTNATRGKWVVKEDGYTEGKASLGVTMDHRSGDKLMHARAWKADSDLVDISSTLNKDGEFYLTFDLYADPEYVGQAKNYTQATDTLVDTKNYGLEAGRFQVLLYSKNETVNAGVNEPYSGKQSFEIIKWERTNGSANESNDWNMFGLEDGLQPGWNHMAIKLTAKDGVLSHPKAGQENQWDPENMWGINFLWRLCNWTDPSEKSGTVDVRIDDVRFMSVAAYEADFARVNSAKTAIDVIAGTDIYDDAQYEDACDALDAVPANAKYLVTNADKLKGRDRVINESLYAVEGKNVGSGWILIPAGPQDNTPYGTTPTPWTENFTEGTGAGKMQWLNTSNPTMHMGVFGVDKTWDFTNVEYITMDLYVHGFTVKKTGDTDFNFGFGESKSPNDWSAQNKGWLGKDIVWEAGIKDLKEGWNHLVFPVPASARINGIGNMRLFFEKSVVFNVEEGDKPYAIIDDIRAVDTNGLKVVKELDAAKDVVTAIQEMDTLEEMVEIRAAYNALNDTQKAYVFNLDDLEALEKDALAGMAIDDAYEALYNDVTVYHPTDAVDDSVVNINSGSWAVSAENGAIKATATKDLTKNAFCVGFRAPAVTLNDYDTMTFDLFIPEGVTVPDDTYGYAYFADKHTNNQDERVWRYEIKAQALAAEKGTWTTITVPVADQNYSGIVQITVRLAVTTAANGYILIDNLQFNKAIDTLTFANKAGVDAVYAEYAALADAAKAYVSCADELIALKADLDAKQVTLDDANAKIALIPAIEELELMDKFTINAANKAYNALAEDVKPFAVGADIIAPAYAKIDELYANASAEDLAEFVSGTIMNELPSADAVTLADAELVYDVAATYEELEAKDLVSDEAVAKLYALRAVLAALQADADGAAAINEAVAALPAELTLENKDAVYAAADAYAALNDNAKGQVTVADALAAAVAAMDKLVADDAAIKAITEAVNALADDASAEDMEAVVALYDAANAEVLAGLDAEVAAKCVALKAKLVNMNPYEITFRNFDTQKADYANNIGDAFFKKDIPAVGTGYMGATAKGAKNELHHYIYAYDQNHQDKADGSNADGMVKFLVDDPNALYVSFDFYVADAAPINAVSGDCGFGIDANLNEDGDIGTFQAWGSTFIANRNVVTPILKEVKTGWNHIVLPLSLVSKSAGQAMAGKEITLRTMRFYMVGVQLPDGFVTAVDDVRFMNKAAAEKIYPARTNAKVVTDMIRAYPAEATDADFYNVYLAYNAVADEYKDLIIGWDAFVEANAAKKAAAEEAMTADMAAATPVVDAIDALDKDITIADKEAVEAAEEAYGKLSDNQKVLVGNDNILTLAREALDKAIEAQKDVDAANVVTEAIDALPATVSETDVADEEAIVKARADYDALSDAAKGYVTEETLAKLVAAEANIIVVKDMAAAAEVEAMIDALPTPTDVNPETHTDVVNAAMDAYNGLTAAQKEFVSDDAKAKLLACVEALTNPVVTKGDVDGDGKVDAKDALEALKITVGKVTPTEAQKAAADADGDGTVGAKDALEILKYVVKKPSALDK